MTKKYPSQISMQVKKNISRNLITILTVAIGLLNATPVRAAIGATVKNDSVQPSPAAPATCATLMDKYNQTIQSGSRLVANANQNELRYAYWGRANCNYRLGRFQQSLDDLNFMLDKNWVGKYDLADFYNNRGNVFFKLKNYNQAIANYTLAINGDKKAKALFYLNRGNSYQVMGDYEKALKDYNQGLTLAPNQADIYANRGNIYLNNEQNDLAWADYTKALNLGNLQGLAPATIYLYRGIAGAALTKQEDALNDFNRSLGLNQTNPDTYVERGKLLIKMNKTSEAVEDFTKAIELDKTLLIAYQLRGLAKKSLGLNGEDDLETAQKLKN